MFATSNVILDMNYMDNPPILLPAQSLAYGVSEEASNLDAFVSITVLLGKSLLLPRK